MTLCYILKKSETNICSQYRKLIYSNTHIVLILGSIIQARGYTTFFMLNSTEDALYHAHKCLNADNFGILTVINIISTSESLKGKVYIQDLVFEQLKFQELSMKKF